MPGKSHGQKNLAGYSPWGQKKNQTRLSDSTTTLILCKYSIPHKNFHFIYLTISHVFIHSYDIQWTVIPLLILLILFPKSFLIWSAGALSSFPLYPFSVFVFFSVHHFLALFFFPFWHRNMFQAQFILSLHQLWNQPFLQGALVPFRGECYLKTKSWTLAVLIAIRVFLTPRPSQWTELRHIFYTDTHTRTHTHTCTNSVHLHLYFYI